MKAHLAYLRTVIRHKWFVFKACRLLGVPLRLALIHDLSKFSRAEWSSYVHTFYNPDGSPRKVRDASGAYDPVRLGIDFDRAWLHHQRNPHHWQAWISLGDGGTLKPLPMPEVYIREMIADWIGAGMAYSGKPDPAGWYEKNESNLVLHPETRRRLEEIMASLP